MKIIVTGGAGFIGANFLNQLVPALPEHQFINLDKLTYAANLGSLRGIEELPNYTLRRVDITDMDGVDAVFEGPEDQQHRPPNHECQQGSDGCRQADQLTHPAGRGNDQDTGGQHQFAQVYRRAGNM